MTDRSKRLLRLCSQNAQPPFSALTASRLLEHFYQSPNQEFHTRIVRRYRLLHRQEPRKTSTTLLLAILCLFPSSWLAKHSTYEFPPGLACFMPAAKHQNILSECNRPEIVGIRRRLLTELVKLYHPVTLPHNEPSLDDGITAFMLTMISPSEQSIHSTVPFWVAFLKFIVQKLDLNVETESSDQEEKEERRRYLATPG